MVWMRSEVWFMSDCRGWRGDGEGGNGRRLSSRVDVIKAIKESSSVSSRSAMGGKMDVVVKRSG